MCILITGARGRVGSRLAALLEAEQAVACLDLPEVDLSDPASVEALVELGPELVIHCAAWTDVDGCARDPDRALRVNAFGTRHVALACQRLGAPLLHLSTNEVFDGQGGRPYLEYDRPNPVNPYGYSKWVAEQIVRELVPRHYIVRTSWLIAHGGRNFVHKVLEQAAAGRALRVVVDEVASPTYNDDLAEAVVALLRTGHYGTYHLVNEGHTSRWGLARFVLDHTGYADVPVEQIGLADYPRPSTPPPFTPLRNMAAAHLGIVLRPWQEAVLAFLQQEGLAG